jgi:hypothetical protein
MGNAAKRFGGAAVAAMLLTGCETAGPGAAGTVASSRPTASAPAVASTLVETRQAELPVPAGMRVHLVEFATAARGFALLVSDTPVEAVVNPEHGEYRVALFATTDGGRNWSPLRHPRPVGRESNMYVGAGDTVMLSAWPNDWYISGDGGRTFRHTRLSTPGDVPPEYLEAFEYSPGPYRLRCATDGCLVVERRSDGRTVAVPAQPEPGTQDLTMLRVDRQGRIWVVGLDAKRTPVAAMSPDGGRTWQTRNPPVQGTGTTYAMARFMASADGADLWLVGSTEPHGTTGARFGRSAALRKEIGLPDLWRLDGDAWVSQGRAASRPDAKLAGGKPSSVAPVGGGRALVAGGSYTWLVDDEWTPVELPTTPGYLGVLRDGTIHFGGDSQTRYLGTWDGSAFRWIRVVLTVRG